MKLLRAAGGQCRGRQIDHRTARDSHSEIDPPRSAGRAWGAKQRSLWTLAEVSRSDHDAFEVARVSAQTKLRVRHTKPGANQKPALRDLWNGNSSFKISHFAKPTNYNT